MEGEYDIKMRLMVDSRTRFMSDAQTTNQGHKTHCLKPEYAMINAAFCTCTRLTQLQNCIYTP